MIPSPLAVEILGFLFSHSPVLLQQDDLGISIALEMCETGMKGLRYSTAAIISSPVDFFLKNL